jgi:hypothetical protein
MPSFEAGSVVIGWQFHVVKQEKGGIYAVEFIIDAIKASHLQVRQAYFKQFSCVKLGGKGVVRNKKPRKKAGLVPRTGFEPVIPP